MFLFSGVLAPLLEPRYSPGAGEASDIDAPEPPFAVRALLEKSSSATGVRMVAEGAAVLLDRRGLAFMALQTHLGCLLSTGGPLGRAEGRSDLVADFVGLARAGGRIAVVRNAREEDLPLYRSHGMVCNRSGEEAFVEVDRIAPHAIFRNPLRGLVEQVETTGATVQIVPASRVSRVLDEILEVEPGLDPDRLHGAWLAVARIGGGIVAVASIWSTPSGSEFEIETLYLDPSSHAAIYPFLIAKLVLWSREQGCDRLSLGTRRSWPRWAPAAALLASLPVTIEPRYTARPGGLRGAWAWLTLHALTEDREPPV